MERQAKLGLGIALIVTLLFSLVLYLAPGALPWALGGRPTSEEVVQAFEAEGLEVGTYYDVEDEEEIGIRGIQPRTYVEGTRFTIPSLEDPPPEPPEPPAPPELKGPDGRPLPESQQPKMPEMPELLELPQVDQGGRVFIFESQDDLEVLQNYYEGLGRGSGMWYSHVFAEGNVLLQINGELPKAKAEEYEAVLKRVAS